MPRSNNGRVFSTLAYNSEHPILYTISFVHATLKWN